MRTVRETQSPRYCTVMRFGRMASPLEPQCLPVKWVYLRPPLWARASISDLSHMPGTPRGLGNGSRRYFLFLSPVFTEHCRVPGTAPGTRAQRCTSGHALPPAASSLFLCGRVATVIHVLQRHNVGFGWRHSLSPTQQLLAWEGGVPAQPLRTRVSRDQMSIRAFLSAAEQGDRTVAQRAFSVIFNCACH